MSATMDEIAIAINWFPKRRFCENVSFLALEQAVQPALHSTLGSFQPFQPVSAHLRPVQVQPALTAHHHRSCDFDFD